MYKFYNSIKDDIHKRLAFNGLAQKTFGINFEAWYLTGGWNDNYITYSYFDGEECIANASYNPMTLIIDGQEVKAIQIGTVMTDPAYRGKGLAQDLIEKIIEDNLNTCDLFFLAAEEKAASLYKRCGFHYRSENFYGVDVSTYDKVDKPLNPFHLSKHSFIEAKSTSVPLSEKLCAIDDVHVAYFYYTLGFDDSIFMPIKDIYTLHIVEDDTLHLYDIYAKNPYNLQDLVNSILHKGINKIQLHFTPSQPLIGQTITKGLQDWMVRPNGKTMPEGYRFPTISKT